MEAPASTSHTLQIKHETGTVTMSPTLQSSPVLPQTQRSLRPVVSRDLLPLTLCPLCLQGELTMTSDMETLQSALYLDTVPEPWARQAYPSTAGLAAWFLDLLNRVKELEAWTGDFAMPSTVWLTGFFNPQSFLTAIMQSTARKNGWPLDQVALQCDVTKRNREELRSPPREGAYVHGLFMEGARWDAQVSPGMSRRAPSWADCVCVSAPPPP